MFNISTNVVYCTINWISLITTKDHCAVTNLATFVMNVVPEHLYVNMLLFQNISKPTILLQTSFS
jgi:hypothetical protein